MTPHQTITEDRRIISLAFHSLTNEFTFGSTNYSPKRFRKLVKFLRDSDRMSALADIQITFDDGYAHLHDVLPDLIAQTSIRPLVFMPTAFIGKSNSWDYGGRFRRMRHLNAEEIQLLARVGVAFGSHSHSHCDLTRLGDAELREELSLSKTILSEITGTEITAISYPFGKHSARKESALVNCGYTEGYTMSFPTADDSPLSRGRIPVYFFDTIGSVVAKIRGHGLRFTFEKYRTQSAQSLSVGTVILQSLRVKKSEHRL